MKKSEIMVSMPMNSYEELLEYKKQYEDLVAEIRKCFDTTQEIITFDTNKSFVLSKKYLLPRFQDKTIIKTE